jgi:transcriptional regulator with XRE-family HTH domain
MTSSELRATLKHNNITQAELAREFDVSRQLMNYWCTKAVPRPWQILIRQYFATKEIEIVKKI